MTSRLLLTAALIAFAVAAATGQRAESATAAGDVDCSAFANQSAAQSFFVANGGPGQDPHNLDGDRDGVACESLPCPCGNGSTSPGPGIIGGPAPSPPPLPKQLFLRGEVTNVVDGDTIDVRLKSGRRDRVRLVGVDTPEVHGGYECGGPAASAHMKRIALGRQVRLTTDPTQDRRDRYGRLLAYVKRIGGPSLQVASLRSGWAKVYVYDRPFRRLAQFQAAEDSARAAGLGSWSMCGPGF